MIFIDYRKKQKKTKTGKIPEYYIRIPDFTNYLTCPKCKKKNMKEMVVSTLGRQTQYECTTRYCNIRCSIYINDIANDVQVVWYYMKRDRRITIEV